MAVTPVFFTLVFKGLTFPAMECLPLGISTMKKENTIKTIYINNWHAIHSVYFSNHKLAAVTEYSCLIVNLSVAKSMTG
jgi:hypothetical protein